MDSKQTVEILKAFYFGCDSMEKISRRTRRSREEVREALKGARACGLIKYNTVDYNETFAHVENKKLGTYLRSKGFIK